MTIAPISSSSLQHRHAEHGANARELDALAQLCGRDSSIGLDVGNVNGLLASSTARPSAAVRAGMDRDALAACIVTLGGAP